MYVQYGGNKRGLVGGMQVDEDINGGYDDFGEDEDDDDPFEEFSL